MSIARRHSRPRVQLPRSRLPSQMLSNVPTLAASQRRFLPLAFNSPSRASSHRPIALESRSTTIQSLSDVAQPSRLLRRFAAARKATQVSSQRRSRRGNQIAMSRIEATRFEELRFAQRFLSSFSDRFVGISVVGKLRSDVVCVGRPIVSQISLVEFISIEHDRSESRGANK